MYFLNLTNYVPHTCIFATAIIIIINVLYIYIYIEEVVGCYKEAALIPNFAASNSCKSDSLL